jgi:hypothetical protein
MTGPDYDAEFEAFLKRRSPMHRRLSDIDHAEPSVELDRLVLNRARDAVETPSQPLFRNSRWALPLGLAAAILIAFTVVLNIDHHHAKVASDASPAAEGTSQAPAVARAASMRESAKAQRVLSDSAVSEPRATTVDKKTEAPAPAAPLARNSGNAETQRRTASQPEQEAAAAASAPAPAAVADNPHSSPDAWLREINRLRAAGRTADADRELAAFRSAYPTHPAYSVAKPPAR